VGSSDNRDVMVGEKSSGGCFHFVSPRAGGLLGLVFKCEGGAWSCGGEFDDSGFLFLVFLYIAHVCM